MVEKLKDLSNYDNSNHEKDDLKQIQLKKLIKGEINIKGQQAKENLKKIIKNYELHNIYEFNSDFAHIVKDKEFKNIITLNINNNYEYYFIGDLHQDTNSLFEILKVTNFIENYKKIKLIFLGDYIDRGEDTLNLINYLIFLKLLFPKNIYLLKGNHETYVKKDGKILSPMQNANEDLNYHFTLLNFLIFNEESEIKQIKKENELDKELIYLYAKFFDILPYIAMINNNGINILAVHGGIARANPNNYFNENSDVLNKMLEEKDCIGCLQKDNMIWSDPIEKNEMYYMTSKTRFTFDSNQFYAFIKKYNIDYVIRAHESFKDGYKLFYDNRLISIFSSGKQNLQKENINEKSFYTISPKFLKLKNDKFDILSINFDQSYICVKDIKLNKINDFIINPKINIINPKPQEIIYLVDLFNGKNVKYIYSQSEFELKYEDLYEYFSCIPKDFHLKFQNEEIINLSEKSNLKIWYDKKLVILKNNAKLKIKNYALIGTKEFSFYLVNNY